MPVCFTMPSMTITSCFSLYSTFIASPPWVGEGARVLLLVTRCEHASPCGVGERGASPSSGDECVSKSEGYQIETDLCRPPIANCHPAILLPLVTWWVTATDVDGF